MSWNSMREMPLPRDGSEAVTLAACARAGVLPHEVCRADDGTLVLSVIGVRKLIAIAPNRTAAALLGQAVTEKMRSSIRPVEAD